MIKTLCALLVATLLPAYALAYTYATPGQFIGSRTLVSFWRNDCGDCAQQVPILISMARFNPGLSVAIVVLHGEGTASLPTNLPSNMRLFDEDDAATSLRNFGAIRAMLPFTAMMKEDGSICTSHAGVQGLGTLEDWAKKC